MFLAIAAEVAAPPAVAAIIAPQWIRKPSGDDFARLYPEGASSKGLQGRATLSCGVDSQGALVRCMIETEQPTGEGFGEAALKMVPLFHMGMPPSGGAIPANASVKIPIRFQMPGALDRSSPALGSAQACYGQTAKLTDHNPSVASGWQATVYWYIQMAKLLAPGFGVPSELEAMASKARQDAEAGTLNIPKGSELEACISKATTK